MWQHSQVSHVNIWKVEMIFCCYCSNVNNFSLEMNFHQKWHWRLVIFVPTTLYHSALCAVLLFEQNLYAVQEHATNLIHLLPPTFPLVITLFYLILCKYTEHSINIYVWMVSDEKELGCWVVFFFFFVEHKPWNKLIKKNDIRRWKGFQLDLKWLD